MDYIAHKNENDNKIQTVKEHLENVAELCQEYAIPLLQNINYNIGLLHDIGKYQLTFQERINGKHVLVEHSGAGAKLIFDNYKGNKAIGLLAAYCIAGHHSGLPNGGVVNDTSDMSTLFGRLKRQFEDYSAWKNDVKCLEFDDKKLTLDIFGECGKSKEFINEKFAFFVRYCYSCLTDADSIDTGNFCDTNYNRKLKCNFAACLDKVNKKFASFTPFTELQKARNKIQEQVFRNTDDANIYLMNMPTGSGKTLCSVKFALEQAVKFHKKRIIYVIPFNSIIDQTAQEFETIFGTDAEILRHQSTFTYEKVDDTEDYRYYARFSAENWNAEFIITTAVQFFESLASNRRSKVRKLHNLADSLLIFDEAHMLPLNCLQPCLQSICFISRYLNSKVILLTATMPDYRKILQKFTYGQTNVVDLVTDRTYFKYFKKCTYKYLGTISNEQLIINASKHPSCLIIVNRRKAARTLYKLASGKKYHLSTYMTAFDRQRVIAEVKSELQKLAVDYPDGKNIPEERRILVVSTSLIEAGVDLDFYTVFRELTGLDSILQAGGRCNREGKRKNAEVFIYQSEEMRQNVLDVRGNITIGIIEEYQDISSFESIEIYYSRLFAFSTEDIDKYAISKFTKIPFSIPFADYAQQFKLINNNTVSLVIDRDEVSRELVEKLKYAGVTDMRKLQLYTCSVYKYELDNLLEQGVIAEYGNGIYCLTNLDYYDDNLGILFEGQDYIIEEGGFIL